MSEIKQTDLQFWQQAADALGCKVVGFTVDRIRATVQDGPEYFEIQGAVAKRVIALQSRLATATAKIERLEKAVKLALKAIDHADNGHCAVMPEGLKTTVCHEYRKFNLDGTLEKCRDPECLSNVLKEALEKENTDA